MKIELRDAVDFNVISNNGICRDVTHQLVLEFFCNPRPNIDNLVLTLTGGNDTFDIVVLDLTNFVVR